MLKFKLRVLQHPTPDNIDVNNRKQFASTVLWLEDQKIRLYRIEDREALRKVDDLPEWEKAYCKYKQDINMPQFETATEDMCFLLGYAVRFEYLDAADEFNSVKPEEIQRKAAKSNEPSIKAQNFFDNMDFNHPDFVAGVRTLASQLGIAYHPDHLKQLEAVKIIVHERLSPPAAKDAAVEGEPFPFDAGNDVMCDDPNLDKAARILRLLQIQSLRKLQTKINETIVAVQNLTADPKTDTKLGKVGF